MQRLTEVTRNQLISKARKATSVNNTNRWESKAECTLLNTDKDYNSIDMNTFWKNGLLIFNLKVKGSSGTYLVTIEYNKLLTYIQKQIKDNEYNITYKIIYDAVVSGLNSSDIKIACTCPDYKYRFKYQATKDGYNSGKGETRPAKKTNPDNDLGSTCKHALFALNNAEWVQKICKIIFNYITYSKQKLFANYKSIIFSKLFNMSYTAAEKLVKEPDTDDAKITSTMKANLAKFL